MSDMIEKIIKKLPDTDNLKPSELVSAGIFSSVACVRIALRNNVFTHLRVSSNRIIIPRDEVIKFLESNLHSI